MTTDEIREYFASKGVSQREVARFIGVDTRTVRRWFAGYEPPKLFILAIQADMFDVQEVPSEKVTKQLTLKKGRSHG